MIELKGMDVKEVEERKEITGSKLKYSESGICPDILRAVEEMGFEIMTPIQEQAIPILLEGKDVIGQAQTGTGKTAAFAIPMIQGIDPQLKKPQGIILCPTRELAMQAAEEIRRLAKYMHGIKVLPVYGGQEIGKQIRALGQGVQIIVGTPGRVMDHLRRHTIKTTYVKMIVLDEADEMLDMGFREDIETILSDMPEEHQMALFSATMPQAILDITGTYQKNAVYVRVTPKEITVAAIKQAYYRVAKKDKVAALCRLIDYYRPSRSLIFCNTKRMVDEITGTLKGKGYEAEGLHGDLTQYQRDTVMNLFRSGGCAILIATDVAARGIDVSGVDAVFNFDVPEDIEYYVHRIGRTGRAGRKGRSFTLISGREIFKIRDIERICHTTIRERSLPTASDLARVKSDRLFAQAGEVIANDIEQKRLSKLKSALELAAEEQNCSVLDLAAAFMQMHLGDAPEDIEDEKPYLERKRLGRREKGRESDRDRRQDRGSREGRGDRAGKSGKGERSERYGRTGRGEKTERFGRLGKSERSDKASRGARGERDSRLGKIDRSEKSGKSARDRIGRGFLAKKK